MKQRHRNNYKINGIFTRTFLILILATIIPVVAINTIIYKKSITTIQRQTRNTNMNMLAKTGETVDIVLKQVDQTMQQIAKDPTVINSIINPDINAIDRNSKVIANIKNIASTNNYILSIYIYSAFNKTIMSSSGGIYKLEEFYDTEWLENYDNHILGTHQMETRRISDALGNQYHCVSLFRTLPYESWSKLGAIVVNINEDKLYETITGEDTNFKGEFYLVNYDAYLLSHKNKDKLYTKLNAYAEYNPSLKEDKGFFTSKVNGKKTLFTYIISPHNEWVYLYALPVMYLQNDSAIISRLIVITTFIYILLGLFLSFLISRGVYNPIQKLINLVTSESTHTLGKEDFDGKDEYEFLGYAYNQVVDRNKSMQGTITTMRPIIKEKLFVNLLLGKSEEVEEIQEKLRFLELDFESGNFVVVIMQIDNYSEFRDKFSEVNRNIYKVELIARAEKIISDKYKGICVEIEWDKIAAIINFDKAISLIDAKEISSSLAEAIKDEVERYLPFTITLGIGRMYKDILNMKLSYDEAINALKYKIYQGKNEIINIDDIDPSTEELYYYESEKEKMLINNLKIGHQEEVEILINELCREILESRNISYTYVHQTFIRIINSIIEMIMNLGMSLEEIFGLNYNLYEDFSKQETIEDIKVWLWRICKTIIDNLDDLNTTKTQKSVEKILEYIDENLNSEISLNDIADHVNLSPTYVSKIFKENVGKNYIDYLNMSRTEKAKQLLENTQLAIKEIGFKVGFNNIQTFMRTFKKYEGITPGQFRDKKS